MEKRLVCKLWDKTKAVHVGCQAPVCQPLEDCGGHLTKCTVPAFLWKRLLSKEDLREMAKQT